MNRIVRSESDALLFGVCGGLGEATGVDPNLIRVGFALLALAWGLGVVAYLLLAFLLPSESGERLAFGANLQDLYARLLARRRSLGVILIALGVILFLSKLGLFQWLTWDRVWPVLLILAGLALLKQRS